ncbi:MAG: restriction endonuclease subunit S [Thermofilum sp.]|nr:restriction endonuclease subunit S [Thermofilum sp.]
MKLYRETEFQETEIGKIPKDWKVTKLGEITLEMYYGLTAKAVDYPTELKMLRTTDIKDYNVSWEDLPYCEITDNRKFNIQKYLLQKDDIIISRAGTAGVSVLVEKDFENVIFGSYLIKVRLNKSLAFPKFIHYYFQSRYYWKQILPKQAGSTLKNISLPTLRRIVTPLPPFEEQKRITGILSTVDKTLVDVDKTINRLERLKKALMGELLAGRIRVKEIDGKLTFYRETEFQETEIGKIPKDWKTAKLKDVAEIRGNKKPTGNIKHVTFIPMEAIPDNKIYTQYEILDMHEVKSFVYCEPGDILLAKITPSFENGKQGIVPLEIPGNFALATTEVYPIKCKNIDAFYLFYLLKFSPNRNKLKSLMRGTTGRRRVPRDALEMLTVPIPPRNEQQKIAEILSTFDRAIEFYRYERSKLEKLKNGLMSVLLTGKVRVRED